EERPVGLAPVPVAQATCRLIGVAVAPELRVQRIADLWDLFFAFETEAAAADEHAVRFAGDAQLAHLLAFEKRNPAGEGTVHLFLGPRFAVLGEIARDDRV